MFPISSNHFPHDDQVADVVRFMRSCDGLNHSQGMADGLYRSFFTARPIFNREFPEWDQLDWLGSWIDTEASGVEPDYSAWVADWLEANTPVQWIDGEPYAWIPAGGAQ